MGGSNRVLRPAVRPVFGTALGRLLARWMGGMGRHAGGSRIRIPRVPTCAVPLSLCYVPACSIAMNAHTLFLQRLHEVRPAACVALLPLRGCCCAAAVLLPLPLLCCSCPVAAPLLPAALVPAYCRARKAACHLRRCRLPAGARYKEPRRRRRCRSRESSRMWCT